jgi:hypothetical protein
VPTRGRPDSFFGRFRAVPSHSFANAIVILYGFTLLGRICLNFRVDIRPDLERAANGRRSVSSTSEHFVAIGLALLPAYWVCWRRPSVDEPSRTPAALTLILAFIVWWSFLIGHVVNNIRGFGS